jgi:pectate lyase
MAFRLLFIIFITVSCKPESDRITSVRIFADNVLENGIDRWSGKNTPLLADGINIETNEPLEYVYDGRVGVQGMGGEANRWIIHNLARQQNLFRTLIALSNLTGDTKYRDAAERSIRYHFDSLRSECGLLRWGTHQIIDMRTMKYIGHSWRSDFHDHELNTVFPFYELLADVDDQATMDFVKAHWNAHIIDWNRLEFNRHGRYGKIMGKLWDNEFGYPDPFYEISGLPFLISAMDLVYSAVSLYLIDGDEGALEWAKRLAEMYVRARHPETGLGASQFGTQIRHRQPPDGPLRGTLTWTPYGDRADNQFGMDFPGIAREPWELFNGGTGEIYFTPALIQLEIAEKLGSQGKEFLEWTVEGLKAFARYAYIPDQNNFRPLWADGTDLTGYAIPRTGYFGREGRILEPYRAHEGYLFSYSRAFRLSNDTEIWKMVRSLMKGLRLGDPGASVGDTPELNMNTDNSHPNTIFALLELSRALDDPAYLELAEIVGKNILARSFHKGYFLTDENHKYAEFYTPEPLALLSLEAALRGKSLLVPTYSGGRSNLSLKTE